MLMRLAFLRYFNKTRVSIGLVFLGLTVAITIAIVTNSPTVAFTKVLSWQAWLTIGITTIAFLSNALTTLPAEIIFLGSAAVLFLFGIIDEKTALAGFSNSGMITVGVLYIVVAGLQQTGALQWVSQQVLGMPKTPSRALVRLMLPVMGASAFLNNTPVVAMFIPVVNDWCRKLRLSPSKLMIPLSYAAIFGGLFSLIGTSTNLVINGLLIEATQSNGLRMFDITWVGLPCGIAGFLFLFFSQKWLLPDRNPALNDTDNLREYTVDMTIVPDSSLVKKTVEKAGLRHLPNLYLASIIRDGRALSIVTGNTQLQGNDRLLFVGDINSVLDLQKIKGLQPDTDEVSQLDRSREEHSLIEAVVSNSSPVLGQTIKECQFRNRYNAVVVAVARNGERLIRKIGDIRLLAGDTLLMKVSSDFINKSRISRDFYSITSIPNSEPLRHSRSHFAIIVTLGMVILAATGWLSMLQAAIIASIGMLVFGCCSPHRALRDIDWSVLLVIAGALAIGQALDSSGAAKAIADGLIGLAGDNPWLLLTAICATTTILTEIVTNNAAAALVFPIAMSLAKQLEVSYMPFVIVIAIAASASFATPIGYQTNLMVYGPGGYKFADFLRIGIPLNILYCMMAITIAPLVYPF